MNVKTIITLAIICLVMISLTPVIWDAIYSDVLTCISSNTTALTTDCEGNVCTTGYTNITIDESNTTVLTVTFPTWMHSLHYPIDTGTAVIKESNVSSGTNYTLTTPANYTINYGSGLINFTLARTGGNMVAYLNYNYSTTTKGSCCETCVTGASKTLIQLIPFFYVAIVIIGFMAAGWIKSKE